MNHLGEWYQTGEDEPPENTDILTFAPLTKEEKKQAKEAEYLHFEWWAQERANERNEKRRQKYKECKQKIIIPIDPLPESDLCPYEKLRDNNIKKTRSNEGMQIFQRFR